MLYTFTVEVKHNSGTIYKFYFCWCKPQTFQDFIRTITGRIYEVLEDFSLPVNELMAAHYNTFEL